MSSVSLRVIATGKYNRFLPTLLMSAQSFFLRGHDVHFRIYNDEGDFRPFCPAPLELGKIEIAFAPYLPWPLPTLLRYHIMTRNEYLLPDDNSDFIFYIDADMEFVRPVGDEILGDLVAVQHPGFFGQPRHAFTYETNQRSRACVYPHEGTHYFAGGFQGGSREHYGKAMAWMRDAINEDLRNHVIAEWHDESMWQRYLIGTPPTVILSPDYCSTPQMRHDTRKIVALDKNHEECRS